MSVIIDAGPLIKGVNTSGFHLTTTPEVLSEVRDKMARKALALRVEDIHTSHPTEEDVQFVVDFAKQTGDYPSLSDNDICLIALAVKAYREQGKPLKASPGVVRTNMNPSRGWDGDWVMPTEEVSTYLMTLDFAMQNVATQMGIRVMSAQGLEIRFLKRWVLKCKACLEICPNGEKPFCPACGNHTLYKISSSVDAQGNVQYHEPKFKKRGLRGTIYSIPMPKGGRSAGDLILREDQLLMMGGRQNKWNWKTPKAYDTDALESFNIQLQKKCPFQYGHGRKNPNEPIKTKKRRNKH